MRSAAHRTTPAHERPSEEPAAPAAPAAGTQTLTVVWVYDGLVCMTIVDPPAPSAHGGVCHCPACHCDAHDDWDGTTDPLRLLF